MYNRDFENDNSDFNNKFQTCLKFSNVPCLIIDFTLKTSWSIKK